MIQDPWHFTRRELAAHTLSLLTSGPARALTLFAPRRTGKTEFLLKDLGPLAEAEGHRVIYASFWQQPLSPLAVLLHALETSLQRGRFSDRVRSTALALAPKLKLSATAPGAAGEAEIDLSSLGGKPPGDLLLYLDELLGRASHRRRATVLMLDEVQELARGEDNAPLVAALRTGLDKRSDQLKTVFTGSSQYGLAAMFAARQTPFFHFATPINLPPLGEPFVDHLLETCRRTTHRTMDRGAMLAAFQALHVNPYFFRLLVETMILDPILTVERALEQVRYRIADELGYSDMWLRLTPVQRAVTGALAQGIDKPFSRAARDGMGAQLDSDGRAPSSGRVQAALRRLRRLGLANADSGGWKLADPEFAAWIREHVSP